MPRLHPQFRSTIVIFLFWVYKGAYPQPVPILWTMDAYPPEFTNHEFPLIVLSGLTDDSVSPVLRGPTIECNLPIVQSDVAKLLAHDFSSLEESGHEWSPRTARSKKSLISYKFKFVGRVSIHLLNEFDMELIRYRAIASLLERQIHQAHSTYIRRILWPMRTRKHQRNGFYTLLYLLFRPSPLSTLMASLPHLG